MKTPKQRMNELSNPTLVDTEIQAQATSSLISALASIHSRDRRSDQWADARPLVTRSDAARDAGMSPHH